MTSFGNLIAVGLFIIGPALCEDFDPSLVKECDDVCKQGFGSIVLDHGQGDVPIAIADMKKDKDGEITCGCTFNYEEMYRVIYDADLDVNMFKAYQKDYWEATQWLKDHGFKLHGIKVRKISPEECNRECLQEGGYIYKKTSRKSEHKKIMSGGNGKEKSHTNSPGRKRQNVMFKDEDGKEESHTNSPGKKEHKVMFKHGNKEAESQLHKGAHEKIGKDENQQEESRRAPLKTGHLKNIKDGKGECECRYRDDFYLFLERAGCNVAAFKERKDNSTEARRWLRDNGFSVSVIQAPHRHVRIVMNTFDERDCADNCHETQGLVSFKKGLFKEDGYGMRPIAIGADEDDHVESESLKIVIPKGHGEEPLECHCKINPDVSSHLQTLHIDTSTFKKEFLKGGAQGCNWLRGKMKRKLGLISVRCSEKPEKPEKSKPPPKSSRYDDEFWSK